MKNKIYIGSQWLPVNEALPLLTDDVINYGGFCEGTVMSLRDALQEAQAKLSERKTIHEWLNQIEVAKLENGKPLCLLRRVRILCNAVAKADAALIA